MEPLASGGGRRRWLLVRLYKTPGGPGLLHGALGQKDLVQGESVWRARYQGTQGCRAPRAQKRGRTVRWGPALRSREARPSPTVAMHLGGACSCPSGPWYRLAGGTAEGLLACVPQHVAFEVCYSGCSCSCKGCTEKVCPQSGSDRDV